MKKIKIKKKKVGNSLDNFKRRIKYQIDKKGIRKFIFSVIMIGLIVVSSLLLVFALYIIISAPDFDKDLLYSKEATIIYDLNGNELARIGRENRDLITYNDLPQVFVDALVATEDSRFFQHNGLDIARFLKASFKQLIGSDEGGASTLSMQLVKKTFTQKNNDRETRIQSFIRKFRDIYISVFKLENSYTKEEIIEFYANSLWFGNDGNLNYLGIYGVEQASQHFFGKSISELTLAETSLLVGMYQNPAFYNPYRNPEGCKNRQKTVLKLMVLHGYITEDEKDEIMAIPIESLLIEKEIGAKNENQAIIDLVIDEVEEKTGNDPKNVPMRIYTTIDPDVQKIVNNTADGQYFTFYNDLDEVGIAITDVETGAIVALSGGRNYVALGLNRATNRRQPGSTAKPFFDYGPYIEYFNGSSGDYFFDDPYTYSNGTPISDADHAYQGMITIREALVGSRNITALQAFQKVMAEDTSYIADYAHSFGIDFGGSLYESASIGGFDGVSPIEMSAAYGAYARGGYYIAPYIFSKIIYDDGTIYEYKPTKEKVVSEETAYMITSSLISAVQNGWSGTINVTGTEVAGKTGTTNLDYETILKLGVPDGTIPDSWSASYSPEYSIALWYGYDKLHPEDPALNMNTTTGWRARSELMAALANRIYSTNRRFKVPSGIVRIEVEKYTVPLQLPSEYTPDDMRMVELFKEGMEPTEVSVRYQKLDTPTNGKANINKSNVELSWNEIKTPLAIDNNYLQQYFNDNYGVFASKYYEKRISDNATSFGQLGYTIYQKNNDGTLKSLGWTSNSHFIQAVEPNKDYTFVIKASYELFKANESGGLEIKIKTEKVETDKDQPKPTEEGKDKEKDKNKDTGLD